MLWNAVFLLAVFGLTMYAVFHGQDLGALWDSLRQVHPGWLAPSLGLVVLFIWGESVILWMLLRAFHIPVKKGICFLFSCVGFFFSAITPSASGGQPMQVYYMKKERIPIPTASVALLTVTIVYKLVLAVLGLGMLVFGRGFMARYLGGVLPVFYLGLTLTVGCILLMLLLVFHPVLAESLLQKGLRLLQKLRLAPRRAAFAVKLHAAMETYRAAAAALRGRDGRGVLARVCVVTFLQRLALFAVPCVVALAFGVQHVALWDVLLLQAVIAICVDMLPLPGGMGISEALFLRLFVPVFSGRTLAAMVLARGVGFYGQLLLSAALTVVTQLHYTLRERQPAAARRSA